MKTSYAYARGYYDGRDKGVEENPYSGQTQPEKHAAYTEGYERGVSDYAIDTPGGEE
jgi:hypothetical protein